MYSLITWIICWKTIVNLCDFHLLNLNKILSGHLGLSSCTLRINPRLRFWKNNIVCWKFVNTIQFIYIYSKLYKILLFSKQQNMPKSNKNSTSWVYIWYWWHFFIIIRPFKALKGLQAGSNYLWRQKCDTL